MLKLIAVQYPQSAPSYALAFEGKHEEEIRIQIRNAGGKFLGGVLLDKGEALQKAFEENPKIMEDLNGLVEVVRRLPS